VNDAAVGGHLVTSSIFIAMEEGMHLTDVQLSTYSGCIADTCSSYGLIVDGATTNTDFHNFFCGSTMGIRVSSTAQVNFNGLRTTLTGVVPPFCAADFYKTAGPYFDITVQNTAKVRVNADAWTGGKLAFVDPTAELIAVGGDWREVCSKDTVPANTQQWIGIGGSAASQDEAVFINRYRGHLFFGLAKSRSAPGGSTSYFYNVFVNGVMVRTYQVAGAAKLIKGYSYVFVDVGDEIAVQVVTDPGSAVTRHNVSLQFLAE
jgi:hypothetical protein